MVEKRQWLQESESGLSEHSLHKKYKKDIRTVKNGLESARINRDYSAARITLMKDVLSRHQGRLLERLREYQKLISVPELEVAVLSWYRGDNSVFSGESPVVESQELDDPAAIMLHQHLKNDKLWKYIEDWQKTYQANMKTREALQRRILFRLKRLGYPVVAAGATRKPCLYAHTVGPLFYQWALQAAFYPEKAPKVNK